MEYEDILEPITIYSLVGLTSYFNKFYGQCSRAFIKLETLDDFSAEDKESYQNLALDIFTKYAEEIILSYYILFIFGSIILSLTHIIFIGQF